MILATRRAVDARVTDPVRLTANAIGALNVELAVVGEGLFDTDYPGRAPQVRGDRADGAAAASSELEVGRSLAWPTGSPSTTSPAISTCPGRRRPTTISRSRPRP